MTRLVVSDTTAILHLAKIEEVNILKRLYTQILIPEEVFAELMQGRKTQPEILKPEQGATVNSGESYCKMKPKIPRVQEARITVKNSHVTNISTNRQDGESSWP